MAAVAAATMLVGGSGASANPIYIGYKINGGATQLGSVTNTGAAFFNAKVGNITFNLSAIGSPILAEPNLFSVELGARNSAAGATANISVFITETRLTTKTDFLTTAWTNNALSSNPITFSSYAHNCVIAGCGGFGTADVFSTVGLVHQDANVAKNTANFSLDDFPMGISGMYTETLVYTFKLGRNQSSSGTLSLTGSNRPVPEPLTLSLFGAGLAGVAAIRRRKQKPQA